MILEFQASYIPSATFVRTEYFATSEGENFGIGPTLQNDMTLRFYLPTRSLQGWCCGYWATKSTTAPNYASTMILQVELFSFIFWENWRYQKHISKLTDLYHANDILTNVLLPPVTMPMTFKDAIQQKYIFLCGCQNNTKWKKSIPGSDCGMYQDVYRKNISYFCT